MVICWLLFAELKICWSRYFFIFIYNHYLVMEMLPHAQQNLWHTQTILGKHQLAHTQPSHFLSCPNQLKLTLNHSQQTLPDSLAFQSRSFEFEQHTFPNLLEEGIEELQERYKNIHNLLIKHSQYQSKLHQRKRGYRPIQIDHKSLGKDFSNKLHIIEEIKILVSDIGTKADPENNQLLQTKFQQYYLERHYGGLNCEVGNLSIQQRLDSYLQPQKQQKSSGSKIEYYESLVPESKITYSEEFCQTQQIGYDIYIEVPRIIEVEVPVIIFKYKTISAKQNQSEMGASHLSNIDDIINKFSKPYEDLYSSKKLEHQPNQILGATPITPSSMIMNSNIEQPLTQVELVYSEFPQEDKFKLPLQSYAQIQSFISIYSRPASERSHPRTDRQTPLDSESILITEKVTNKSVIQKFELNERALLQENGQLKQTIHNLGLQIKEHERICKELENQNRKLASRLEEEIQQSEYLCNKLDQFNVQVLEEKLQCLTHLNDSKQRKIEILAEELKVKQDLLQQLTINLQEWEERCKKQEQTINVRQEQIVYLNQLLIEKENQLNELTACQQDVMQTASQIELGLKAEIQRLERQKIQLKETIKYYKKRVEADGINLQIEQASQIQTIIQSQQHNFDMSLQDFRQLYDKVLLAYQHKLNHLHTQLLDTQNQYDLKVKMVNELQHQSLRKNQQIQKDCSSFEEIVDEYNKQLEMKDKQILALKTEAQEHSDRIKSFVELEAKIHQAIESLQNQLNAEIEEKHSLALKLSEMEAQFNKSGQRQKTEKQVDAQLQLIEQLSSELSSKCRQNQQLKRKIQQQQQSIRNAQGQQKGQAAIAFEEQNKKLKTVNNKLKKYTSYLQQEITNFCVLAQNDTFKNWALQITQQRNYYLQLALQGCKCQRQQINIAC